MIKKNIVIYFIYREESDCEKLKYFIDEIKDRSTVNFTLFVLIDDMEEKKIKNELGEDYCSFVKFISKYFNKPEEENKELACYFEIILANTEKEHVKTILQRMIYYNSSIFTNIYFLKDSKSNELKSLKITDIILIYCYLFISYTGIFVVLFNQWIENNKDEIENSLLNKNLILIIRNKSKFKNISISQRLNDEKNFYYFQYKQLSFLHNFNLIFMLMYVIIIHFHLNHLNQYAVIYFPSFVLNTFLFFCIFKMLKHILTKELLIILIAMHLIFILFAKLVLFMIIPCFTFIYFKLFYTEEKHKQLMKIICHLK